ncbi:electron transfer flavoprotein beta subunit lysine methyltransferase-like [Episyrphus balteatus]|uniref:electron transfer flavoprotein beta subunit lysine methyltransferase-like n=1 Tax=Episyrphus balteatus TaxID=286459 RepID=UPI002485FFC5|nr:electron transfer flavoprotein beta subunit lysine methyltransferase-like [Episyrphus balteatus]XP_055852703.1 electron transfer flavoprotein beta subunit lysine methyltransferase-like [Episyrphus balteatus]
MTRRFYYLLSSLKNQTHNFENAKLSKLAQRIEENTQISRAHLTPEIALRLITPECRLFHEPIREESEKVFENDPFWGFYWPGGQALSRFILDNPILVESKKVLDVGSGCGASSIAAMMSKAKSVTANDIDPIASVAAQMNSKLNGLRIGTNKQNLIGNSNIEEDVILLGDVFYDADFAETLLPWLHELHNQGKMIFVGDPGRHGLTENRLKFMKKLASYELTENCCIENNGFKNVHVWKFR